MKIRELIITILLSIFLSACGNRDEEENPNIKRYEQAESNFKMGNYAEAIDVFNAILSTADARFLVDAHIGLAWAALRSNTFSSDSLLIVSRTNFSTALDLASDNEDAKFGLIQLNYIEKIHLSESLSYADDILADNKYEFKLDESLNHNHILYHKALIQYYEKEYLNCKVTVESLAINLGKTISLNANLDRFEIDLGQALSDLEPLL